MGDGPPIKPPTCTWLGAVISTLSTVDDMNPAWLHTYYGTATPRGSLHVCFDHQPYDCYHKSKASKIPQPTPPPSQNKVQIGFNSALFGPNLGMGVA